MRFRNPANPDPRRLPPAPAEPPAGDVDVDVDYLPWPPLAFMLLAVAFTRLDDAVLSSVPWGARWLAQATAAMAANPPQLGRFVGAFLLIAGLDLGAAAALALGAWGVWRAWRRRRG
jgi:hypothetical protein